MGAGQRRLGVVNQTNPGCHEHRASPTKKTKEIKQQKLENDIAFYAKGWQVHGSSDKCQQAIRRSRYEDTGTHMGACLGRSGRGSIRAV